MPSPKPTFIGLLLAGSLLLSGCSQGPSLDEPTVAKTLVEVAEVDQDVADCAAKAIFAEDSGFDGDQISEANKDMSSVDGFEEFAIAALTECGAFPEDLGPTLNG